MVVVCWMLLLFGVVWFEYVVAGELVVECCLMCDNTCLLCFICLVLCVLFVQYCLSFARNCLMCAGECWCLSRVDCGVLFVVGYGLCVVCCLVLFVVARC